MAEILHDEDDPRIRVAAARALLERGWGRPAAMNEDETSMNETDATQREQAGQEAYRLLEQLASHKRGGGARPDAVDQDGAARTADARGDWRIWLILAGRGWGKTRTGAEDAAHYALWHEGARLAVVAPTYADARDTCVEGDSGLLSVIPPLCVRAWNRSLGELVLVNGSRFKLFSADRPERLRGPQHHRAWADELAAWPAPKPSIKCCSACAWGSIRALSSPRRQSRCRWSSIDRKGGAGCARDARDHL